MLGVVMRCENCAGDNIYTEGPASYAAHAAQTHDSYEGHFERCYPCSGARDGTSGADRYARSEYICVLMTPRVRLD